VNALPLALSLTSTFTKVGAIAGFAALLGIALLSLLAFAQAREIKRLREWAGRAPERAAEMEQRVSTEAAARLQRAGGPPAAAAAGAVGARVVPRKTPLVSAPVSTAVNATVAAGKIGAQPDLTAADPAKLVAGATAPGEVTPAATAPAQANPVTGGAAQPGAVPADVATGAAQPGPSQPDASPDVSSLPGAPMPGAGQPVANGAGSAEAVPAGDQDQSADASSQGAEQSPPAPATAAARAAAPAPRSPLPPSPSAPMPPGVPASTVAGAAAVPPAASAAAAPAPAQTAPPVASRLPAPVAASRPAASRAVASPPAPVGTKGVEPGARKPASPRARGGDAGSGAGTARTPGGPVGSGPKYFKQERSSGRTTLLVLGGVVLGVAVIVLAVSALKGGAKPTSTATQSSTPSPVAHTATPAPASNPSDLSVAVVNGTSTNDLAHHLAADLQQSGYTRAEASSAVPPGTHATTVVQYTSGHRADGQAVAKVLDVTRVQPMEASTASLVSHATVVVVAGADQAAQLGGGAQQSTGEPSAGTSGEGGAGGAASGTGAAGEGTGAGGAGEGAAGSGQ
jgi:LytR cell envelope-related transcriptional attenuator